MKHIVCFSGGHSSAIVAIMVAQRFPNDTILLNHNITSETTMYTEICKIIEASQVGDRQKAEAYARLLAVNLDKAGKPKEASRILRALGDQTIQSHPVTLDGDQMRSCDNGPMLGDLTR